MLRRLGTTTSLILMVIFMFAGCTHKPPVKTDTKRPTRPRVEKRVKDLDLRREPEVRILLVKDVSAVEVRSQRGFVIMGDRGHRLAEYGASQRIHMFQRPESPDRLSIYSELRRGGRKTRAARKRLPFDKEVYLQPKRGGTIHINGRTYRGRIKLLRTGRHFHCLNLIPLETYLCGVVPHEIGHLRSKGFEALKAQAVASRNYAVQRLQLSQNKLWDMVDSEMDQVYRGAKEEWHWANRAINATRGQILWNGAGMAEIYYSSTCGGATASIDEVWDHAPMEHLTSMIDNDPSGRSWCRTSKYYRWQHSWSGRDLGEIIRAYLPRMVDLPRGGKVGRLIDLEIVRYTPEGRAQDLKVVTTTGTYHVRGDRIRSVLKRDLDGTALRSIMFRLEKRKDARGNLLSVTAKGAGWGHGIGMCQVGVINRSYSGQGYQRILSAYFPGTQVRRLWR
ncbi:MAG: SpoIID/LytB domain-containing protein [bacterium]|nr:SpoIID/LytB domain-containing protein [bacterium]